MGPLARKSAPTFSPPSPLSSPPAEASDSEPDPKTSPAHDKHQEPVATEAGPQGQHLHKLREARPHSPPDSFTSQTSTRAHGSTQTTKQRAGSPRGRSRTRCGSDVEVALRLITASWQGLFSEEDEDRHTLQISPSDYLRLCRQLGAHDPRLLHYFENELRTDYDPDRGILVLRFMASAVHEYIRDQLLVEIMLQLREHAKRLSEDDVLSSLLSDIKPLGNARVKFGTVDVAVEEGTKQVEDRKYPDCQLRFRGTHRPRHQLYHFKGSRFSQFVVEIGFSQERNSLQEYAGQYHEKSHGAVKTVLTIDIEYKDSPRQKTRRAATPKKSRTEEAPDLSARFCLYRGPDRVAHDVAFRSRDGATMDGSLRLLLSDFIPDVVLQQISAEHRQQTSDTIIDIPFRQLCEFLGDAEFEQTLEDGNTPPPGEATQVRWKRDRDDSLPSSAEEDDTLGSEEDGAPRSKKRRTSDPAYRHSGSYSNLPERTGTRSRSPGGGGS